MNARIICMFSDSTGQWRLSVQAGSDFWALPIPTGAHRDFLAAGVPLRDDDAMRRAVDALPAFDLPPPAPEAGECLVCHGLDPACGAVCGLRSTNDVRSMCISLASFIAAIDESSEDVAAYLQQRLGPLLARADAATFDAVHRDTMGLVKPHPLSAAALRAKSPPVAPPAAGEAGRGETDGEDDVCPTCIGMGTIRGQLCPTCSGGAA